MKGGERKIVLREGKEMEGKIVPAEERVGAHHPSTRGWCYFQNSYFLVWDPLQNMV